MGVGVGVGGPSVAQPQTKRQQQQQQRLWQQLLHPRQSQATGNGQQATDIATGFYEMPMGTAATLAAAAATAATAVTSTTTGRQPLAFN